MRSAPGSPPSRRWPLRAPTRWRTASTGRSPSGSPDLLWRPRDDNCGPPHRPRKEPDTLMDFHLSETALAVRDGVAAIAAKYDNTYWSECDEAHRFPIEVFTDLGKGGWFGLNIPEEYGGGGRGLLELARGKQ